MKKQILFTMLLAMFAVASWGQETITVPVGVGYQVSTNVENPEYVYTLKNGWFRRMTPYTSPTETLANAGLFAFFCPDSDPAKPAAKAVQIYSVIAKKWLSYEPAASYSDCLNFVQLVDDRSQAKYWALSQSTAAETPSFDIAYKIRPYTTSYKAAGLYLNWLDGKVNYPNDDHSKTAGLTSDKSEDPIGAFWLFRLVGSTVQGADVDSSFFVDVRDETEKWLRSLSYGEAFGQYKINDRTGLDNAWNKLATTTDVNTLLETAQDCRAFAVITGMKGGGVYRFKNVANGSYWGMTGADCRQYGIMPGEDTDCENNPMIMWKYEIGEDGSVYLRNFYSGLYSVALTSFPVGREPAATRLSQAKTQPFRCTLVKPAVKDTLPIVTAYLNSTRVAAVKTAKGEIRISHALTDESYFYVEEIGGEEIESSLDEKCVDWYVKHGGPENIPDIYIDLPKLPYKSETADTIFYGLTTSLSAEQINQYIDDVNIEGDVTHDKIIKKYNAIVMGETEMGYYYEDVKGEDGFGAPISEEVFYDIPNAEYATICVPAKWDCPSGVERFYCTGIDNETAQFKLDTMQYDKQQAGIPYLIKISPERRGKRWQFVKYKNDWMYPTITQGSAVLAQGSQNWLTGILECNDKLIENGEIKKEGYNVPAGQGIYVLARRTGTDKIGFSLVTESATKVYLDQYKCYLKIADGSGTAGSRQSFLSISLSDVETGIDDVLDITQDDVLDENQDNGKIYNMSGQRLNRMQKGLNIVNGKIVIKN